MKSWRGTAALSLKSTLQAHIITLLLGFSGVGCVGSILTTPAPLVEAKTPKPIHVIVADLEREPDIITEDYQPFFAGMARALRAEVNKSNLFSKVTQQRDISGKKTGKDTFFVVYRITNFAAASETRGAYWANFFFAGLLVIPWLWHGLIRMVASTIVIEGEMHIYNASDVEPMEYVDPRNGSASLSFNRQKLERVGRRDFRVQSEAHIGYDDATEQLNFNAEWSADLIRKLLLETKSTLLSIGS
jgi:hypothetical protein